MPEKSSIKCLKLIASVVICMVMAALQIPSRPGITPLNKLMPN